MVKFLLPLFLLFFSFSLFAQDGITVKGKLVDKKSQLPIEAATVYLSSVKDSTVIDYTISDKNGIFKLDTKKITKPFILKISYLGYESLEKEMNELLESKDFGNLVLIESENVLNEVVVKSDAPPIRIKKDTLEFNASSFKVRPDANVETLLKQLPGVNIDEEGKITVNGKEVNQILVNGKPFFDKDGKIALQSLPADIINKIQVTDTKSKKQELNKEAGSSNNSSINITIDKDKNKGLFGKVMGGMGSDNRYESNGLVNYFKDKRKISVLASSNNINSTGFSMDEVFDNMAGGRTRGTYYSGQNSFAVNGVQFGGGNGITRSNMLGLNYTDEFVKDLQSTGSYFFTNARTENENKSNVTTFLPTGNIFSESNGKSNSETNGNNLNFEFEYKIDSLTTIVVAPKFNSAKTTNSNESFGKSLNTNRELISESAGISFNESDDTKFKNSIFLNKRFKGNKQFIAINLENENSKNNSDALNESSTIFKTTTEPDIIRNQKANSKRTTDNYHANLEFSNKITDSLSINVGLDYRNDSNSSGVNTFDRNTTSADYTDLNGAQSNYLTLQNNIFRPQAGIVIRKKNINFSLSSGSSIIRQQAFSRYRGQDTNLNKSYVLPSLNSDFRYAFSKSKSMYLSYDYRVNLPSAQEILPVEDISNPLNTSSGNENLNPNKAHSVYVNFNNYDHASRSGYYFYLSASYFENQVVSTILYDQETLRSFSTYENMSGNYSAYGGGNWNKTIKKEANIYKFTAGFFANYQFKKGFADGEIYEAKTLGINPRANFTYELDKIFTVSANYTPTYSTSKFANYTLSSTSNTLQKAELQTTNYWGKRWVFGNDFSYTYNSNISDGYKKDFYLWNTSLAYNFYKNQLTAKVKVYDVLNQNQNAVRYISPTNIYDTENTVMKRYLMFSLMYKISKFGGKDKKYREQRF